MKGGIEAFSKEGVATPGERHAFAMDMIEQAMRCNDKEKAVMLRCEALQIEQDIAQAIPENKENEPSRSIMYRSAGTLANSVGFYAKAKALALEGLQGCTHGCLAQELFDVYKQAVKGQAMRENKES